MNKYGITNKSGECQVIRSKLGIEDFIKHLNSAEWVCLRFSTPSHWNNPNEKDMYFNNIMVSINNIESISFMESEE